MEELIKCCKEQGLRITKGLKVIMNALDEAQLPLSLQELEVNPQIAEVCDRATVFRTLQRLEGIGLLRRLNFSHSGAKFSLNTGKAHKEYLICRLCGEVKELKMSCPVHQLEEKLSEENSYSAMTHELTFYGICRKCN